MMMPWTVSDIIHNGASTSEPCFDAGRLTTQHLSDGSYYLLRHREPDAAQGEEARRVCATWLGPLGSNRMQQSNLGQRGGRGEILLHTTIKLRTTWRTWRYTAAIAPCEAASVSRKARAGGDTPAPHDDLVCCCGHLPWCNCPASGDKGADDDDHGDDE